MNKSNFFSNIKSKINVKSKMNVKSNTHNNSNNMKGGAAQPAQAGQAPGGKEGNLGTLPPQANAFNMLPVLFNTFVKILPIGLYAATLIESVLFNDLRGFFYFPRFIT